jgi:hypothetical protein
VKAVARAGRHQLDLLARDVEAEQVDQLAVGAGGDDLEAADAVGRLAGVQRLDGAQVGDLAEQLDQLVGQRDVVQRAHTQLQRARLRPGGGGRRQRRGGRGRRRSGCGGGCGRAGCGRRRHVAAFDQRADGRQQLGGVGRGAAAALVARQLRLEHIAGVEQHVDHRGGGLQLVAAQLVQQRLHLVGQLGHIGEAEGRGAALDRVRAAEDRVQRLVVGLRDVQAKQHLLHRLEVLAGFLEEDLVELAQVDAGGHLRAFLAHLSHCGLLVGLRARCLNG